MGKLTFKGGIHPYEGKELAKNQPVEKYDITPDIIIGCAGGGSNLGGLISPFMGEKLRGEKDYQFIAVEPASCPSLTREIGRAHV